MSTYLEDILSQPTELRQALEFYNQASFQETLDRIRTVQFREIIWSGMGSSHFCSYPAHVYLASQGICSQIISTGELLHYEQQCIHPDTLLCLISQSGESAEIVRLLEQLPDHIPVVAITNNPDSTLGKRGNFVFPLHVSNEKSVTTRTYLASVIITMMVAYSVAGKNRKEMTAALEDAFGKMEKYLTDFQKCTEELVRFSGDISCISVMGRGPAMTTVRAGALFFREVARAAAIDFDSAEFRHGPMEMVDQDFFSIVLAPSGRTQHLGLSLADSIAEKGGRVILITDTSAQESLPVDQNHILRVTLPTVEELYAPFLQILPIQLLADALAKKRGISAGDFRWGSKITAIE